MKMTGRGVALLLSLIFLSPLAAEGQRETVPSEKPAGGSEAVQDSAAAESPRTVRIAALKGPTGFGMIRMFDQQPELGDGVVSEWSVIPSPDIMIARVLSGEVDVASLPTNVAAKLSVKGVPYRLAAVTGYGVLYLLSRNPEIQEWEDLKGRTVHNIARGSTPEYVFEYLLKQNGLKSGSDVKLDYSLAPLELAQSFIAGRVDLVVLPEPFVTKALMAVPEAAVALDLQKEWAEGENSDISYPMSAVVISASLISERPDVVRNFLNAYRDSIQWVNSHPEEAGVLIGKHGFGMQPAEAAVAIPRCNLVFLPAGDAEEEVEEFLSVLMSFSPDSVGGRLPDEAFYYSRN